MSKVMTTGTSSCRNMNSFTDILEERRHTSDVAWITREWNPVRTLTNAQATNPMTIRKAVLNSLRVKEVIKELSQEREVAPEILYKEVEEQLIEIGHNRQISIVRWIGLFVTKVLKKTCSNLMVNEEAIVKLKTSMGNTPVIFAPSHRSYADFILMAYICFHYCIEIPCVAAGVDFMAMWLMGTLLRDCCAFFMRRQFSGDKLYYTVFSEYVRTLICQGTAPVEFFIEGTRSRSAKSLVPKFGFLSMALEPFLTGQIPDVLIVPISISYDRILEEKLFSYELLGVPKPKESTSGLIKALNALDEKYGKIYADFGEPISVRDFLQSHMFQRSSHSMGPIHLQSLSDQEMAMIRIISHHIVRSQQQISVLSPFHLVAVILNNNLLTNGTFDMQLSELVKEVAWFRSVIEMFGATVDISGDVEVSVREALHVHKSLITLLPDGAVQLKAVHTPGTKIDISRLKGHSLLDDTMNRAVPLLMLQHYVNPTLHFLANPAMITTVMQHLEPSGEISRENLFIRYQLVRGILSHEFVMHKAWEEKDFDEALKVLDLVNIVETTSANLLSLGNHRKLQVLLCNVLHPFFAGYLALSQTLAQVCGEARPERLVLCEAQRRVEMGLKSGEVSHPAALSLDGLGCGLQALVSIGAIHRIRRGDEVLYVANLKELKVVTEHLETLVALHGMDHKWSWQQLELHQSLPAKL
ncbi:Dihydroxyacetone phosphate acyltransferase [Frankliniella fusca]|uniref:Dihydroxyacetone phosphate acyltransferase n=1 Tax=Frankliniella fusca TaxID=407009 RepID=A0AAE1I3L5_9NEOP|nr:Dihydroxyacetone phosphate acyltransferase [Frankliniella fusca]